MLDNLGKLLVDTTLRAGNTFVSQMLPRGHIWGCFGGRSVLRGWGQEVEGGGEVGFYWFEMDVRKVGERVAVEDKESC